MSKQELEENRQKRYVLKSDKVDRMRDDREDPGSYEGDVGNDVDAEQQGIGGSLNLQNHGRYNIRCFFMGQPKQHHQKDNRKEEVGFSNIKKYRENVKHRRSNLRDPNENVSAYKSRFDNIAENRDCS